ncbi:MAG: energy transducer TonB [Gammaproteobacteria bacterium]|nr:energy transducer TonB [Gammaproteobacteria bacterium]
MEALIGNRPLWIALGVSLVLHIAFVLFVKPEFRPLPTDPIVLNMRLVKPVGPLPSEKDAPLEPAPGIAGPEEPVFEDIDPDIGSTLNFENMLFPDDFLADLDIQLEEPDSIAGAGTIDNPIAQMSVEDMVQSIADIAVANSQGEEEKRIRRLAGDGTSSIEETFYLRAWLRKVRRIGQMNYPSEAVEKKLYGTLSLYVSIAPDGSLVETRVLESSGHEVLDKAAVDIVKLAAPFAQFPASIAKDTELLEIVREWEFRKGTYTTDPPSEEED